MADIEAISHQLAEAISRQDADYVEARLSDGETSSITYRGRQLESIGRNTATGGNVRAMVKGGWGFVCFNNFDELAEKVALAVKQARFVGKEESQLAPIDPAIETVASTIGEDPTAVPLAEKKQLLDEYNDIICGYPKIQTSMVNYSDGQRKTIFLNI